MVAFDLLTGDANAGAGVAQWFFFGFVALALVGLSAFIYGLYKIDRKKIVLTRTRDHLLPLGRGDSTNSGPDPTSKIWARSKGVNAGFHESLAIRDLLPGLRARDPYVTRFALRAFGLAVFVLSTFLAIGTGMLAYSSSDDGSGWGFIGFVILMILVMGYQMIKGSGDQAP